MLASGGSPFGLGSDIGGSIRIPAFFNGIFGHKPTKYVVSNIGQYPAANTDAQNLMLGIGPMSRFATDLKPMLKVLANKDKLPLLRLDEPVDIKKIKFYYQEESGGNLLSPVESDLKEAMQKVHSS